MRSLQCPKCGLVAFASEPTCKRCGESFETPQLTQTHSDQSDAELGQSIKAKKSIIYVVGLFGTLALSIAAAVISESTTTMIILFSGILVVGFIWTWVLAEKAESRMLGGRKDIVYITTPAQRASVVTSSIAVAFVVSNADYGYILAPLIIVIFNGALFLYDRQMRAKRDAARH